MRYNRLYKDNNFLTPTTYTQELSEYAVGLRYEDIPPEVVERAKMIMLQTVGAALAAKGTMIPFVAAGIFYYVFNLIVALAMEMLEKKMDYYR